MAVVYDTTTKNARLTATRDLYANGTLEVLSAGGTVLAVFTLSATGGSVATAVWTLAFVSGTVTGEAGASTGTAATQARMKVSGGTVRLTGLTVGTSGTDIVLNNTSIASGQNVTLTSAAITHAA